MEIHNEEFNIHEAIAQENYISAVGYIKSYISDEKLRFEYIGLIAESLVSKLHAAKKVKDTERVLYYRSVLLWMLKEVPDLARIYKDLYRNPAGKDPFRDFFAGLNSIFATGRQNDEFREDMEKTFDDIRENVKSAADNMKESMNSEDPVGDVFREAENNLKTGLKQASDFFEELSKQRQQHSRNVTPDDEKGEETEQEDDNTGPTMY
ncbi:MAG: hypothetical protein ACLFR1_00790 [Spirochaetia bacterium]